MSHEKTITKGLKASRERFSRTQAEATDLDEFVEALLLHVNEAAYLLQQGRTDKAHVIRIGLSYVTDDELVVPVPFLKGSHSLFLDEFHAIPLRRTSLASLLVSGKGDTIPDLEVHLKERNHSLSTLVALREGVRSNARFPWYSLDRKGFIFFSANGTRFFGPEFLAWLEELVPQVELQLRLFDSLDVLQDVRRGTSNRQELESNPLGLDRLVRLLDVTENPYPGRLLLEGHPAWPGRFSLVNLWQRDPDKVFLLTLLMDDDSLEAGNLSLLLRSLFLKAGAHYLNPSRILEDVEAAFVAGRKEGWIRSHPACLSGLAFACLHLEQGYMDYVHLGEAQLQLEGGAKLPSTDDEPLFELHERQSGVCVLDDRLLVLQPGSETDRTRIRLRLKLNSPE